MPINPVRELLPETFGADYSLTLAPCIPARRARSVYRQVGWDHSCELPVTWSLLIFAYAPHEQKPLLGFLSPDLCNPRDVGADYQQAEAERQITQHASFSISTRHRVRGHATG